MTNEKEEQLLDKLVDIGMKLAYSKRYNELNGKLGKEIEKILKRFHNAGYFGNGYEKEKERLAKIYFEMVNINKEFNLGMDETLSKLRVTFEKVIYCGRGNVKTLDDYKIAA